MTVNKRRRAWAAGWLGVVCVGLLSAQELKPRAALKGTDWINALAYRPDGKALAIAESYNTLDLWDAATLKSTKTIRNDPVSCLGVSFWSVAFSPDGKTLASAGGEEVRLWDVTTGKNIATLEGHTDWALCVAFSPDGTILASGSADKTVRLWNIRTSKNTAKLEGHAGWVQAVAFSPDGRTLVSGSRDHTVRFWDVPKAK